MRLPWIVEVVGVVLQRLYFENGDAVMGGDGMGRIQEPRTDFAPLARCAEPGSFS